MTKYNVALPWHATIWITVEAKNKKEALNIAFNKVCPTLCHSCSKNIDLDEFNLAAEDDIQIEEL